MSEEAQRIEAETLERSRGEAGGVESREIAGPKRPRRIPEGGQRDRVQGQERREGEEGEGGSGPGPGHQLCPGDQAESGAAGAGDRRGSLRGQRQAQGLPGDGTGLQNRIEKYEGVYLVPPAHILDELAEEFGFNKAGERLKLARERTKLMQANGTAATCGYPDGWKKDHALKFVLSTFNGKVDTVLSRVKPGNQGKLIQEIKDAYALVNRDGEVYKNARIQEEYLDSRLEELKWAVAVQKLKEKTREEQRAHQGADQGGGEGQEGDRAGHQAGRARGRTRQQGHRQDQEAIRGGERGGEGQAGGPTPSS